MGDVMPLKPTRGERNNNPGNIVYDPHTDWVGLLGKELAQPNVTWTPRFCRFDTPAHGIRAIARVIRSYVEKDGVTTLRGIVERWAPGTENDTLSYVAAVASECGLDPEMPLNESAGPDLGDYSEIVRAIIHHENGRVIYDTDTIADAVAAAWAATE